MSGYIEAGYTIVLVVLALYALSVVRRERAARRRLPPRSAIATTPPRTDESASTGK